MLGYAANLQAVSTVSHGHLRAPFVFNLERDKERKGELLTVQKRLGFSFVGIDFTMQTMLAEIKRRITCRICISGSTVLLFLFFFLHNLL